MPTDRFPLPDDSIQLVAERRAEFERNCQIDAQIHLGGKPVQPEVAQTNGALALKSRWMESEVRLR